jgi:glycosyltransferase involved in cell wall biosynthesis
LKVVILGPAHPLRGGISDFNEALATSLLQEGHDVKIFSFSYQYPGFLFPGTSQFTDTPAPSGLDIHPSLNSINPLSWFSTANKIISEKPDVVVIRFWLPFMGPSLGTVAKKLRKKKIKVIAITDNVIPHEKRIGDRLLTRYFIKNCDAFIAMSRSVLNDLSEFTTTDNKIFIPHPVYNIFGNSIPKADARHSLKLDTNSKIILFFGFIRPYKGLNLLLDAMNDERIKSRNITLLVAGEFYEDKTPYIDRINSMPEGRVILHSDFIDKEKIKNYFCAADIVVQPYITATQSGITQIAYHFDRPMLVTNVGGLAEIVADKRVGYVTDTDSKSIADALIDFYDNSREEEFAKNVSIDKEKFSWKSFTRGLIKLNEQIT